MANRPPKPDGTSWLSPFLCVKDVAAAILKQSVHRVLVVDENQHLYGIISSFDFVKLVGDALE